MKKRIIKKDFNKKAIYSKICLFFIVFLIGSLQVRAQGSKDIKGVVISVLNEPLPGASVTITGTTKATMTDADGKFSITVPAGHDKLTISLIGMKSQTAPIGSNTEFKIVLEDNTINLEEVVAVGYGTMQKKDLSGSITNISEKDFNKGVMATPEQLIKGQIAGLVITQPGGDPTKEASMRLRGSTSLMGGNTPLVVIDGVPGVPMGSISPQDIESISVLKDASASAIYGARSANGVIIITTKKGKEGKSVISYNGYFGVEKIANNLKMLTADEWRKWVKDNNKEDKTKDYGANTKWHEEIYRTGYSQNHNLSLSGGSTTSNYRASVNFLDQKGIALSNDFQRANGNISLDQTALDGKLKVQLNLNGTLHNFKRVPSDAVFAYALNLNPTMPIYNEDGSYFELPGYENYNVIAMLNQMKNENKRVSFLGRIQADYKFLEMFTVGVNGSMSRSNLLNGYYESRYSRAAKDIKGFARRETTERESKLLESTLTFDKSFNQHKINAVFGYSYQDFMDEYFMARNRGFITDLFEYNNLGAGNNLRADDVASNKKTSKLISFYARANYSIGGKYIATATIRRDGSTKFGANNKWGTFPSGSIAWRISEEDFMKNVSFVDDLKMRVSYGITGNQEIESYKSLALYGTGGYYYDDGKFYTQYIPGQNPNPNLKWEETAQLDLGLDYYLFNGRLRGSIDYYNKTTSNLLYEYPVSSPPYQYDYMLANVGKVENKGFEISAETTLVDSKDLKWNLGVNFAKNKNTVKSLSNDEFNLDYVLLGEWALNGLKEKPIILKPGYPIGTFYGAKYIGKDKDGIFMYEDVSGDGKFVFEDDRTVIGDAQPDFTLNMSNSFDYKNFSLSFMFRGVFGNDIVNSTALYLDDINRMPGFNVLRSALDKAAQKLVYSSYYVEDGSFVRLEYLTLGYNFKLSPKSKIKSLNLSATANNLFIITGYSGIDPEVNADGLLPGIDARNYYPKTRSLSLGLNLSF